MLDWIHASWMMRRLLQGRGDDILKSAHSVREICPSERSGSEPAIYEVSSLDKVEQLAPWRNWDTERALMNGSVIDHAATKAFELSQVGLSGAYVYTGSSRGRYGFGKQGLLTTESRANFDQAQLVSNWVGSEFFGHFLWDHFSMELLTDPHVPSIALSGKAYMHEEDYRRIFAMPEPLKPGRAIVRNLVVYSDFGQNSSREVRYRSLRQKVRQHGFSKSGLPGVFVRRGEKGDARPLLNEQAVIELLAGLGFCILEPEKSSVEQIISSTLDVRLVVGVEGSQFSHAIYTVADDGGFLLLQPPNRFSMSYKEYTDRMGLKCGFQVGDPEEGGFSINLDELKLLIDRML